MQGLRFGPRSRPTFDLQDAHLSMNKMGNRRIAVMFG